MSVFIHLRRQVSRSRGLRKVLKRDVFHGALLFVLRWLSPMKDLEAVFAVVVKFSLSVMTPTASATASPAQANRCTIYKTSY